jgi:hypothetical protein
VKKTPMQLFTNSSQHIEALAEMTDIATNLKQCHFYADFFA